MIKKFQPIDIIAIIVIIGALILKFFQIDGVVGTILTAVVLFYFGKKEIVDKIKAKKLPGAKSETIEQMIVRIAKEEGIDPVLAVRVAKCESGLNPAAKNINSDNSIDRGLFQWNSRWHPEITSAMAFDPEISTRKFCNAVNSGNIYWWNASKKCWNV